MGKESFYLTNILKARSTCYTKPYHLYTDNQQVKCLWLFPPGTTTLINTLGLTNATHPQLPFFMNHVNRVHWNLLENFAGCSVFSCSCPQKIERSNYKHKVQSPDSDNHPVESSSMQSRGMQVCYNTAVTGLETVLHQVKIFLIYTDFSGERSSVERCTRYTWASVTFWFWVSFKLATKP